MAGDLSDLLKGSKRLCVECLGTLVSLLVTGQEVDQEVVVTRIRRREKRQQTRAAAPLPRPDGSALCLHPR